ncbi:MAG: cholesterol oxidase [Actinomycetota bacterium]|nr:cholesterol oxidase [Actinomycetota bacterium]
MTVAPPPGAGADVDVDVVVVGSGFGGSVAALRLVEKGYHVVVLEAGRRFADDEFARSSWDIRRFLWAPRFGCYGIQRIARLKDVIVLAGAGVGGGSLVYANTLYEPAEAFFDDRQWRDITDWRDELAPHYARAKRMLGVVPNPTMTPSDVAMRAVAEEMGVGDTFRLTPVGVFFGTGPAETVADPYFGGAGPERTGCLECGACMTGCRHGAKNTLPKNYLWLAEHAGARVEPMTTVTAVRPRRGGGWTVETVRSGAWRSARTRRRVTASHVVLAAGALGTQRLLHRMRDEGVLDRLSPQLGALSRTNSESLLGAQARDRRVDYSRGVAITSSFHPAPDTHVEPVRYARGSNLMGLLSTILTDGGGTAPRWVKWVATVVRHPGLFARSLSVRHWSERTVIALEMQSVDNSLVVSGGRNRFGRWRLTTRQGHGEPNPTWIPAGNEAARRLATRIGGDAGGNVGDLVGAPMTAHFIGGCAIGSSPETGVLDAWQRVYGHPGLHVLDGAAVSANLGVNPSLTITAQAERAASFWPNRGDPDPRPPLGAAYTRLAPVPANTPVLTDEPTVIDLRPRVTVLAPDRPVRR